MTNARRQEWIPIVIGGAVVLVVSVGLVFVVLHFINTKPKSSGRQQAQNITLIRPPPPQETPPPPPPPPEEKIQEPIEQPQEQQPEQAPQEALGVDADASAGGDSFGLQARPGGRDIIGNGTAPFKWYTSLMGSRLQECFSEDERLRKGSYRATLRVKVADDGKLEIVELLGTSGSADRDAAIRNVKHCSTGESRPLEMPKLATIQIVSRG